MLVLLLPAKGTAVEMSPEIETALALCARCATLPDEEIPAAASTVRSLVEKLEAERNPADKVWLFRLKRCGSFLAYRAEAAADGEEKPAQ
ncbi:hypothetical protein [Geothermobacter hydrogeniphilus]|uniref:Uncharacterized protein n=1 Tax=Geothermobacter hydrogeniphilus TaxID=1969733 RepID=A0A1X0YCY0_9BACT|nr:hypothetical protein [Geothermobacter hydrogeniphilus]ORJ62962.1 hypothetical protein B5V00_02615 [Geothermobacter hydrogeniphilus]